MIYETKGARLTRCALLRMYVCCGYSLSLTFYFTKHHEHFKHCRIFFSSSNTAAPLFRQSSPNWFCVCCFVLLY